MGGHAAARLFTGGAAGGVSSVMAGGDFAQGVVQGAMTSAIAYVCNDLMHEAIKSFRSLHFDGKHLIAKDGYGNEIDRWDAKSNNKPQNVFKGKTPEGLYEVTNIEPTNNSRMVGTDGFSYKAQMKYFGKNWPSARQINTFFIHPDTGNDGTYGCIGVQPSQSTNFNGWLKNY